MATNPTARMRRHEAKYILVWSGDDIAEPGYNGTVACVPPIDKTANTAAPNSPYRFPAAEDERGPIPGSIVLRSVVVPNHTTGGTDTEFDAIGWCDGIETTDNGKKLLARGLAILDGHATRAEIEAEQRNGRPKWEAAQEAQWNATLSTEMSRRDKLKAQNRPLSAAPNEKAIRDAALGLKLLQQKRTEKLLSDDAISEALGLAPKHAPAPASVTPFPAPVAIPTPEPPKDKALEGMATKLVAIAQKHNVRLKNDEVLGLVSRDEAVMVAVQTKLTEAGVNLEEEFNV